jgi:hypothetical protein
MPVTDEDLLSDLRRVASASATGLVSQPIYRKLGQYDERNISRRFGTWNKALAAAGLRLSNEVDIPDERLFENLLNLWQHFGRQPRRRDLTHPSSTISQSPYMRRFGSRKTALEAFVSFANSSGDAVYLSSKQHPSLPDTGRDPSLRLRYQVLKRDNFKCQHCGRSPAKEPGVELHIDHVIPWSKCGKTAIGNLRTLCSGCNLGKSNWV